MTEQAAGGIDLEQGTLLRSPASIDPLPTNLGRVDVRQTDPVRAFPTRGQAVLFLGKSWCFRIKRWLTDPMARGPVRHPRSPPVDNTPLVAVSRSRLYADDSAAEVTLQAGKVQNLRIAAGYLHGLVLNEGATFSFWAQVPRPTRRRGFARGRELREGCIIASIGGGLCQLSNALYDAALTAGCDILERHAHSRRLPGSMAAQDRDATIFWNYVDLRFRAPFDCQLEVTLTADELVVAIRGRGPAVSRRSPEPPARPTAVRSADDAGVENCGACGMTECFRHEAEPRRRPAVVTAWLVDGWWPEFDGYLRAQAKAQDWLFTPLDSNRFGIGGYRWRSDGFAGVRQAPWQVAKRSLRSRRLASQGAARQRALLEMDAALARYYARRLPVAATHLVVSQNLLPFLWRDGVLGGRSFDVLMTRLPMADLQATLDRAAQAWMPSRTLADFRADPTLVAAESAALAAARLWITPHSGIARRGGAKSEMLQWQIPAATSAARKRGELTVFPASTLGRKGAYELRAVARDLQLRLALGGPDLESGDFWDGVSTIRTGDQWLENAAVVVLPAWVEHQPRRLLQAVAAGVPVVVSDACGLEEIAGARTVATGDIGALRDAICEAIGKP